MKITVLGHRKKILKSLEEIKKNQKNNKDLILPPPPIESNDSNYSVLEELPVGTESKQPKKTNQENKKVHWSHITPITEKPAYGQISINSADNNDDILDEEKERLAFMKAVEEWRKSGEKEKKDKDSDDNNNKIKIIREYEKKNNNQTENNDNDYWLPSKNSSSQEAAGDSVWVNPFGGSVSPPSTPPSKKEEVAYQTQGSLLDGELDEEYERRVSCYYFYIFKKIYIIIFYFYIGVYEGCRKLEKWR